MEGAEPSRIGKDSKKGKKDVATNLIPEDAMEEGETEEGLMAKLKDICDEDTRSMPYINIAHCNRKDTKSKYAHKNEEEREARKVVCGVN